MSGAPVAAIDELIAAWGDPRKARAFMSANKFPLVDGSLVTFVWFGHADEVNLRHWIYGLESSTTLTRAPGTDIWHLTLEIPPNSRVEYKFSVTRKGHSEWIQDPLNKARARGIDKQGFANVRIQHPCVPASIVLD